jgi:predicted Zn-dependent protease
MMFVRILSTFLTLTAIGGAQAQTPSEFECERQALGAIQYLQDQKGEKDKEKIASDLTRMQPWTEQYPDNWVIHYAVGLCALGTKDLPLSLPHLKVAFEKSKKDPHVGVIYMIALKASKQPLEAVQLIKNLADENPQLPQLRVTYAGILMGVQKFDDAYPILQEYAQAKAATPNEDYGYLLGMLGECQLYLGKHTEANASLTEANKLVKDAATFMVLLGEQIKIWPD